MPPLLQTVSISSQRHNTADGGTNGTTVTTIAQTGGACGTQFNARNVGANSRITFRASPVWQGALCYEFANSLVGSSEQDSFTWSGFTGIDLAIRMYLQVTAVPQAQTRIVDIRNSATSSVRVFYDITGKLSAQSGSSGTLWTSAAAIPVNTWVRVEAYAQPGFNSTTGTIKVAYGLGDAPATETFSSSSADTGTASIANVTLGKAIGSTWTDTFWLDMLSADDRALDLLGPMVQPLRPNGRRPLPRPAWNRRCEVTWAPLPVQDGALGTTTRRRSTPAPRRSRTPGALPQQQAVTSPGRPHSAGRVRRATRIASPTPPQVNPPIVSSVIGRLRSIGRARRAARVTPPTAPQFNPPIVPTIIGRLRSTGRVRKAARIASPTPPQINPLIVSSVIGRLRSTGRIRRAGRIASPTPPQFNPPIVPTIIGRLRSIGRVRRAARVTPPTAPQFNPPIVSAVTARLRSIGRIRRSWRIDQPSPLQFSPPVVTGRRTPLGRLQARIKGASPILTQQAVATNPAITATVSARLRLIGRVRPPARVAKPTPSQVNPPIAQTVFVRLRLVGTVRPPSKVRNPVPVQSVIANPSITATVLVRLRLIGRIRPPARIAKPTPPQVNPPIVQTVYERSRTVGRIQPRGRVTSSPAEQSIPNPLTIRRARFGRGQSSRVVEPIPAQVDSPYPVNPPRVVALRGMSRRRGGLTSAPQVQPTAETRTGADGLRGLRRVWLKIWRRGATPIPDQITTLQGPLVITDSHGGVEADRSAGVTIGGVYGSSGGSTVTAGSTGAFTADPDNDDVVDTYDSDSDTL